MRTLKYAILGLLNQKSQTGYELMKEFESTLNEFWSAKHSQIYPELKKLTEEECITYEIVISGTSLEKKQYSITEKGKKELHEWLHEETTIPETPKDITRLKIFFSSNLSYDERQDLYNDLLSQHIERCDHLKNNQKKFDQIPAPGSDAFGDYLVLLGAIMREEMMVEWLKQCIALDKNS